MNINNFLKEFVLKASAHKVITEIASYFAILLIGFLDYATGYQLSFSIFYLFPICTVTWVISKKAGFAFAFYGLLIWTLSDILSRDFQFDSFILSWNAAMRFGFFMLFVIILSALRSGYDREQKLSRTDYLTGIANNQSFFEILNQEIEKCRRFQRPLTIAYMDCDNFKQVNDSLGHQAGNSLLKEVAATIKEKIRSIDTVARLGGDEFVILLFEAQGSPAFETINRVKNQLLVKMKKNQWPVTFSIGIATFFVPPVSADHAVKKADELMYKAKHKGKNRIYQEIIKG